MRYIEQVNRSTRTYWVREPRQLRCMVSARRHDIVDRLVASGPMSIKDLARSIGAQPSSLYHHVKQLLDNDLVVEAGHRVENRKREQLYATPAPRMRLSRAMQERRNTPVFKRIAGSLGRQMERDFRRGIASPRARTDGPLRNLFLFRLISAPSAATLRRINEHLIAITELMWQSEGDHGELVAFAGALTPAGKEPPRRRRG